MISVQTTRVTEHVAVVVAPEGFVLPRVAALQQAPIRFAVAHEVVGLAQRLDRLRLRTGIGIVAGRG